MKLRIEIDLQSLRGFISLVGLALLAAAVIVELRKPATARSWHGRLGNMVPYDLRPPTPARIGNRLWSPNEPDMIVATPFGVGWTINFAALVKKTGLSNLPVHAFLVSIISRVKGYDHT